MKRGISSYLAFDLGAESGRSIVGRFDGSRLGLKEIHRFQNGGVRVGQSLHWDVLRLWQEIRDGLRLAGTQCGDGLKSVAVDTWGVDFGLLASDDTLIANPHHYRDRRTDGMLQRAFERISPGEIYERTGIQLMQINSLFQLLSMVDAGSPEISIAASFLNMPDLFNFFLSGHKASEFTISTTTQCYDPRASGWSVDLLSKLGIPRHIFGNVIQPGQSLGRLRPALADDVELRSLTVVAGAGHDTACAVAAVPASETEHIYISSGTWSLMGVEIDKPIISAESLSAGLTNEGGVGKKFTFLKNINGLWPVQECRRLWALEGDAYGYDDLTRLASGAPPFTCLVVPDDARFLAPANMPETIAAFCRETGQAAPGDRGAILRCVLEGLALEYRRVAELLESLVGKYLPVIHVVGGGSRNELLNQFTADATGRIVIAGPAEATAIGNILIQCLAAGDIGSLAEGRAIVRNSFELRSYIPTRPEAWSEAYAHYLQIRSSRLQEGRP